MASLRVWPVSETEVDASRSGFVDASTQDMVSVPPDVVPRAYSNLYIPDKESEPDHEISSVVDAL